ncbi:MAG: DUF6491 family protein [Caulobacteraceae bacterium]
MALFRLALPLLLAALLTAPAAADPAKPDAAKSGSVGKSLPMNQCIDTTFSNSWEPLDDHTLLVRTLGHAYRVTTSTCQSLAGPVPRITTVMRGGSRICSPTDAQLYVSDGGVISTPCFMQSIEPLTLDEAKALEKSKRK